MNALFAETLTFMFDTGWNLNVENWQTQNCTRSSKMLGGMLISRRQRLIIYSNTVDAGSSATLLQHASC